LGDCGEGSSTDSSRSTGEAGESRGDRGVTHTSGGGVTMLRRRRFWLCALVGAGVIGHGFFFLSGEGRGEKLGEKRSKPPGSIESASRRDSPTARLCDGLGGSSSRVGVPAVPGVMGGGKAINSIPPSRSPRPLCAGGGEAAEKPPPPPNEDAGALKVLAMPKRLDELDAPKPPPKPPPAAAVGAAGFPKRDEPPNPALVEELLLPNNDDPPVPVALAPKPPVEEPNPPVEAPPKPPVEAPNPPVDAPKLPVDAVLEEPKPPLEDPNPPLEDPNPPVEPPVDPKPPAAGVLEPKPPKPEDAGAATVAPKLPKPPRGYKRDA
jgi:hypothetical protein